MSNTQLWRVDQDKYPWLDPEDPRRNMTDEEILDTYVDLSKSCLNDSQKVTLRNVIKENKKSFSLRDEIGHCPNIKIDIDVIDESPFFVRPFPISEDDKPIMDWQMQRLVSLGILSRNTTSHTSPVMLITRKVTRDKRPVVDFRLLNTRIRRHNTATPLLRDIYQMLGKSQSEVLSCVDLKDAFHSLKLTDKAKDYCGILPYFGSPHFRYEVMPMGLSISPCKWIQYIGVVMEGMSHPQNYIAIMDDLLVHSMKKTHMERITDMLKALNSHGLKLSPKKYQFFMEELVYMGNVFKIGKFEISISPIKTRVEAIQKTPPPKTPKQCKSFCGVVNYLSIFCPHLQKLGLTYLLKTIAACNASETPVLEYTANLAFMDYFATFWNNTPVKAPSPSPHNSTSFPIHLEDYSQDPAFPIYGGERDPHPSTLKQLSQLQYQKQVFLETRKKLFTGKQAEDMTPILPDLGLNPKSGKSSFLFTVVFHIYIFIGSSVGIVLVFPYVLYAIKHRKLKTLVAALTMYRAGGAEAVPVPNFTAPLTAIDIPTHPASKLICHDPWVSFLMATITVIGIIVYLYKSCKHFTLVKGHKFASICHIYIVMGNETRYVPIKIGQHVGSPYLFKFNTVISRERLSLQRQLLGDHLHLDWIEEEIVYKGQKVPLRQHVTIALTDKFRLRNILTPDCCLMYMVKQGDTWYQLSELRH